MIGRWLFGYGSPVTIGVVRALVGTLAFVNFLMLWTGFDAWFTERGFTPAWFAQRWGGGIPRLDLLAGVTDERTTALVFWLGALAALLVAFGLASRAASVVLFVVVVSLHHRTPDILHSGDTLLRQLCFLVMVAPSGAAFSLDRLIARRRGLAPAVPPPVSLWPQRLVQFQVAVVYFTTLWHKMTGTTWRDGTATWYPPRLEEFDRFPVPAFMDEMPFVMGTSYGTIAVQFALCTAVFVRPARKWVLLAGLLLHAGIDYRYNIPLFAPIMVATYVAFYEGDEVAAWWDRLRARLPRALGGRLEAR
jgi:hypothetical protein